MPILKGLIFDLDGTLLDSASDIKQAINATLNHNGRTSLNLDEVKDMIGDGMMVMLERAFLQTGDAIKSEHIDRILKQFIDFYSHLKPTREQLYPFVLEILEKYHSLGIKIGLCTNKQEQSTLRLINDLDIKKYFEFVAGGDTFSTRKPHPDHIKGVIQALDLPTKSCVMVGDSLNDLVAAKGANVLSIAVTHGYGSKDDDLPANAVIKNFQELPSALKKLGFEIQPP